MGLSPGLGFQGFLAVTGSDLCDSGCPRWHDIILIFWHLPNNHKVYDAWCMWLSGFGSAWESLGGNFFSLLLPCLTINKTNSITSQNHNIMGRWYYHHMPMPFFGLQILPSGSQAFSWSTTLPCALPLFPITHLLSPEQAGYMSYSLGIQNAFGMSLVYIGVHLFSLSKPFKCLVSSHHTMSQSKSNSQFSFTLWSQNYLALML